MVDKIKPQKLGRPTWHLLQEFFSHEDGLEPAGIDGIPVLIKGRLRDVPVIQVPASCQPEFFDRISKAVTEACGVEPFILTSNVQMLRFKAVSDREALALMAEAKAKLSSVERARERIQEAGQAAQSAHQRSQEAGQAADDVGDSDDDNISTAEDEDRDGDGSESDGIGSGHAVAGLAEGAGGSGGDDATGPGIVEEQEA
jgi:hypothetical protein